MKNFYFLILLLIFSACNVGPRYVPPHMQTSAKWKTTQKSAPTLAARENWWEIFEDPELNRLELLVLNQNLDLYIALQKVVEARAVAGVSKSYLYPQVNFNPQAQGASELFELWGIPQGFAPGLQTIVRVYQQEYQLPVTLSYEFDFWKKYRNQYKSATLRAEAQTQAAKMACLTLTSECASIYYNLKALDTQILLLNKSKKTLKEIVDFHRSRYETGVEDFMPTNTAQIELSNLEAEIEESLRQRALFENSLAVLVGKSASEFHLEPTLLSKSPPPQIPAGVPSTLLLRRPDILEAEKNMEAEHAMINVAYSSYFPSFSLTSGIGLASPQLQDLFKWEARLFQFAINIVQKIFDAKKTTREIEAAKARFKQRHGMYTKTVLVAFKEVEDALSSIQRKLSQETKVKESLASSETNLILSEDRFYQGLVPQLEVLMQENEKLALERKFTEVHGASYQSTIQLIKAMGGRWDNPK